MKNFKVLLILFLSLSILSCEKDDIYELVSINEEVIQYTDSIVDTKETIIINKNQPSIEINTSINIIPNKYGNYNFTYQTLNTAHGVIKIDKNQQEYLLFPGFGHNGNQQSSPILFKRINDKWVYDKTFEEVSMSGIRNYRKINETTYLFSEASENYPDDISKGYPIARPSNIWIMNILDNDLEWIRVNTTTGFYHDASYGDINNDGLFDIVAADSDIIWFQNSNGTFNEVDNVFQKSPYGHVYFTIEVGDILGDNKLEVVRSVYGWGGVESYKNYFQVLTWNEYLKKFEVIYDSNDPYVFHPIDYNTGGTNTRITDINNDGINDLIIGKERRGGSLYQSSIEIWISDGNKLIPHDLITDENKFNLVNWNLLDVNNDGYLDIIITTANDGSVRLNNARQEDGFRLNDLIHINNGDGTFDVFNLIDLVGGEGTKLEKIHSYMRDGNLVFMGTWTKRIPSDENKAESYIFEATLKNIF